MSYITDDREYGYVENEPSKLDEYGRILLHGKGHDRWFDKSFNLCFSTNGFVSISFLIKKILIIISTLIICFVRYN